MFKLIASELRGAVVMLFIMTLLTGVLYPLLVTGLAKVAFAHQASGSIIERGGTAAGSELIGQPFTDARYFWSRPSATNPYPCKADASSGSNLGPTNKKLIEAVGDRVKALRDSGVDPNQRIPVDLVTASASGLDPHISPAAADIQVDRVAKARSVGPDKVRALVAQFTSERQWGIMGEPRVNVLLLNLALDDAANVEKP